MSVTPDEVTEFHRAFNQPIRTTPQLISKAESDLRINLIAEELEELEQAVYAADIVAIADALGDLEYVIRGAALYWGVPLDAVVTEIHHSNMTKLDVNGDPILRADGKAIKGPLYRPPNLYSVLKEHGWRP